MDIRDQEFSVWPWPPPVTDAQTDLLSSVGSDRGISSHVFDTCQQIQDEDVRCKILRCKFLRCKRSDLLHFVCSSLWLSKSLTHLFYCRYSVEEFFSGHKVTLAVLQQNNIYIKLRLIIMISCYVFLLFNFFGCCLYLALQVYATSTELCLWWSVCFSVFPVRPHTLDILGWNKLVCYSFSKATDVWKILFYLYKHYH